MVNSWKLPSLTHETLEEIRSSSKLCKKTKEEIEGVYGELMKLAQTNLSDALALYTKTLEELTAVAENPWELALKSAAKEFGRGVSVFTSIITSPPKVAKAALSHPKTRGYVEGLKEIRRTTLRIESYAKANMLSLYLPETCKAMWSYLSEMLLMCGIEDVEVELKDECCERRRKEGKGEVSNYGTCFVCMSQLTKASEVKEQCHKICSKLVN